jgi:hypothetical protein
MPHLPAKSQASHFHVQVQLNSPFLGEPKVRFVTELLGYPHPSLRNEFVVWPNTEISPFVELHFYGLD